MLLLESESKDELITDNLQEWYVFIQLKEKKW